VNGGVYERIQRLEDDAAIRMLASRYSIAVDDHDFLTLARLWAPDACYGFFGDIHARGASEIAELFERNITTGGVSFHTNHDHVIEWKKGDPNHARGTVSCHAEVTVAGAHQVSGIRYKDVYVRHEGQWLFAERLLGFLYFSPAKDYPGILLSDDRVHLPNTAPMKAHWPAF
jgi:ketosteroid isomerase-like protein